MATWLLAFMARIWSGLPVALEFNALLTRLALVAAALMLSLNASAQAQDERAVEARSVLKLLAGGDYISVAGRLHYPNYFSPKMRDEEQKAIEQALRSLCREFGRMALGEQLVDPPPYFQVGVFAGDLAYWSRTAKGAPTATIVHGATFPKHGPGVVAITFTELSRKWQIQSIELGLLASVPNARETVVGIGRAMIEEMTPADIGEVDRAIEVTIPHR